MKLLDRLEILHLALIVLVVYTALHIHEEAYLQIPLWMDENWGVPITFARWLFHNACFFTPALAAGVLVHSLDQERFLVFGVGVLFWGLLNSLEHIVFTIKTAAVAPGVFSGLLFLMLAIAGLVKLRRTGRLNWKVLLLSFVVQSVFYWGLPIASFLLLVHHIGGIVGAD